MTNANGSPSDRKNRPTLEDAQEAGLAFMKKQDSHIHCEDWEGAADAWLTANVSGSLSGESDNEFTKMATSLKNAFMFGAQQAVIDRAAWHGSQWSAMHVRFTAANRFEEGLPKRYRGQSKAAYDAFVNQATNEFLRGLGEAVVVRDIAEPASNKLAADDLNSLAGAFGWLVSLFQSIEDLADRENSTSAEIRMYRVKKLASLGSYTATDWWATSECMAEKFDDENPATEVKTDLAVTAQAFAAPRQPKVPANSVRESEHA